MLVMLRVFRSLVGFCGGILATVSLWAGDPGNSIRTAPDGRDFKAPQTIGGQFPESVYGIGHTGSNFWFSPVLGPYGNLDYSRGSFHYSSAPFFPRNSEGVYGAIVWLEKLDASGEWNPIEGKNSEKPLLSTDYQDLNTPNPGPSNSFSAEWAFDLLEPNQNYRVFGYVYMYNQGGGDQGAFALSSTMGPLNTGPANDAPRVKFSDPKYRTNPTEYRLGQNYTIRAEAEDDNSNLSVVRIWKDGAPFAFGDASGAAGSSENTTSDSTPGTVTFSAQAEDMRSATSEIKYWSVEILDRSNQPAVTSENAGILLGQSFTPTYNGGAGSGGWQFAVAGSTGWDGSASSNTGTQLSGNVWSASWNPPAAGTYTFYVSRNGDDSYKSSGIAGPYTLTVYGTPSVAWISTPPAQVTPGTALQWSAQASSPNVASGSIELHFDLSTDGGNSWAGNAYQYASNPFSNVVTAGAPGTTYTLRATVNDGTLGSNGFGSAIYHSVVVAANVQNVNLSPLGPTVTAGSPITLTASGGANGYVWGGSATGSGSTQTLTFNTPGSYSVSVYSPTGGAYAQSNTASTTITVIAAAQTVSISPASPSITAGQSVTFTASGGRNGYIWAGTAGTSGSTQSARFDTPGTYTVTVFSPAGGIYEPSAIATATVTVAPAAQTVSISPASVSVVAGQSVAFTATGGQNGYVWGGSAAGTGSAQTITFNSPGSYTVTVYSPAGGIFAQSNPATAAITVSYPAPTASISASPTAGIAPLSTVISWSSAYATSATVSGPALSSAALSGNSSVTLDAGTYLYSLSAVGPAGTTSASVSVSVAANTATLSAASSSVDFGSVFRDTLAGSPITATRSLVLSNPGNAPLTLTAVSFSGGPFSLSNPLALPYSLGAGASVALGLTFGPGAVMGPNSATFTITASSNTATVALSGIGLAPRLEVTFP